MQYSSHLLVKTYIFIFTTTSVSCWQYFTSLSDLQLMNSLKESQTIHSEYFFGDCKSKDIVLYAHSHVDHINLLGKTIIRGWIKIERIPTCILLRAWAFDVDLVRSTAYNFQMCVPRISYCHSEHMYKYYYYEWYLPLDVIGGMDWDIYFFGPPRTEWWW